MFFAAGAVESHSLAIMPADAESRDVIEAAARNSYAQLLAFLASRAGGDLEGAEDALGEAFLAALRQWPTAGVPEKPEAWLLQTARRRLIDSQRRRLVQTIKMDALQQALEAAQRVVDTEEPFPDERLKLMFVCAHPAIDPAARTPLMLQTVLGLEAERIAAAFLTSPAAMSQRLVRAKTKIRVAVIPFFIPQRNELTERLTDVLDAIYVAYNCGWEGALDGSDTGLATEAIWLARVVVHLLPEEPEALGLLALMLHCQARRSARLDAAGEYVPLPEQNVTQWDENLILQAETALTLAARKKTMGRFQLEAAIQSVHAQRRLSGTINWEAITLLYAALRQNTGALGAEIGYAVALSRSRGLAEGLAVLEAMKAEVGEKLRNHQPWWASRAHLLHESGETREARIAFERAIGLAQNEPVRRYLLRQLQNI